MRGDGCNRRTSASRSSVELQNRRALLDVIPIFCFDAAERRALQLKAGQASLPQQRPRALKQLCASPSERYPAFVELQPTEWRLRTSCPDCQQGSLLLVACPNCSHVAVVCEEDGLAFADVQAVRTVAWGDGDVSCPQCGKHQLKSFAAATSAQLLGSGLTLADYY